MNIFSRNIGLISEEQQRLISQKTILVSGLGGMGGVALEVLVRMGFKKLKICDLDNFEETNFNRQIHSTKEVLKEKKVRVFEKEMKKINPELEIIAYDQGIQLNNIDEILDGVDIVINGMDQMFASLILERTARKKKITIVDAWLTPFASVFVMRPDSPHWEEFLGLPTLNIPLNMIDDKLCHEALLKEIDFTFSHFNPFDYVDRNVVGEVLAGKRARPSLAPVVWLSGILMANEVLKITCHFPHTDHLGIFYNQFTHEIVRGIDLVNSKKVA